MTDKIVCQAKPDCIRAIKIHLAKLYENDRKKYKVCRQGMEHATKAIERCIVKINAPPAEIFEDFRAGLKFEIWRTYTKNSELWSYIGKGLMEAKIAVRALLERTIANARGITLQQYYQREGLIVECPELIEKET